MLRIIGYILLSSTVCLAQNHLEVIYPEDGQHIPAVDSTFIFGNTGADADLFINGHDIDVHSDGGFLAFLPVKTGSFQFNLVSDLNGDTSLATVNIFVGPIADSSDDFIKLSSLAPSGRTVLLPSESFEFSFKARGYGRAFCCFENDANWTQMYPDVKPWQYESVFGEIPKASDSSVYITYTAIMRIDGMVDSSRVYYMYENDICDSTGILQWTEFEIDSTDFYVVRLDEYPKQVVVLVGGNPHIIRVAPAKGYKLVNQPAGVRFRYLGETPDYYQVMLADNVYGYVKKIDATLEPVGTSLPGGEVSFVIVNNFNRYVQVSMNIGDKLPFEVRQDGNLMMIDIYGLTSDTDWIRLNDTQRYIKSIWWSQPQNGIYRLNIRWSDEHFWGYKCYYEDDNFIVQLKKRPPSKGLFHSRVAGLRIALDPGHSHDPGAKGPTGLQEKDANLWIAYELRKILLDKGAKVLMTRMGHEDIGLYERVDMATKWDADILISIHNNALPDGVNPFTHNGASAYYYFNQSRPLAEAIHKHLLKKTGLPDHGLYYGNLALTRVTDCPAVLVECAFMMIPEQEAMLKTDKFQRKCAKAIYEGICEYLGD